MLQYIQKLFEVEAENMDQEYQNILVPVDGSK